MNSVFITTGKEELALLLKHFYGYLLWHLMLSFVSVPLVPYFYKLSLLVFLLNLHYSVGKALVSHITGLKYENGQTKCRYLDVTFHSSLLIKSDLMYVRNACPSFWF